MEAFPHEFSAFLSRNNLQSAQQTNSVQQFCLGDVQTGLDFGSTKFSEDGEQRKKREGVEKKRVHRVMERERRKQMKSRYSDLRSLLPHQIIVGKTSITCQLSVATEYICHLQEKLKELTKNRDEMKIINEIQYYKEDNVISFRKGDAFPLVNVDRVGSLVLVTTNTLRNQIDLSSLLLAVEQEGLHLVSAFSFTPNEKVFHTLHCKVFDKERFSSSTKLEQRLLQLIETIHVGDVSRS